MFAFVCKQFRQQKTITDTFLVHTTYAKSISCWELSPWNWRSSRTSPTKGKDQPIHRARFTSKLCKAFQTVAEFVSFQILFDFLHGQVPDPPGTLSATFTDLVNPSNGIVGLVGPPTPLKPGEENKFIPDNPTQAPKSNTPGTIQLSGQPPVPG